MTREQELEVQARVKFKIAEFWKGLNNRVGLHFSQVMHSNDPKYVHYHEAFVSIKEAFNKEVEMTTPRDDLAESMRRRTRDIVVEEIAHWFKVRGAESGHHSIKFIVAQVEKAQRWMYN